MITLEEFASLAMSFPEVAEGRRFGNVTWQVADKGFAWERPFSKADIKRFGTEPVPAGPIAAVTVDDLHEKEALLAEGLTGVFTIEHFENYPAVLIQLNLIGKRDARRLLTEAWIGKAPAPLVATYESRSRA